MIRRLLPLPLISAFLLVMWLLLNESLSSGQVLLGLGLAWFLPWSTQQMQPVRARHVRRLDQILVLSVIVFCDIVRSCVEVTRVVWGARERRHRSGFMIIPLDLKAPHGLAVLSCIISSTPGTTWVETSEDRTLLMIHVLDLEDEQYWIDLIKGRYESRLREIFE